MIPEDFKSLLPKHAEHKVDDRPLSYLWVYDPLKSEIHLVNGRGEHPADFPLHREIAPHVNHKDRLDGYAFRIEGGWRIMDDHHRKLDDPFIIKKIREALRGEHPAPPLPQVRYHGSPEPKREDHADSE